MAVQPWTVPTQAVSMCYATVTTFLIASGRWGLARWAPYAIAAAVAAVLIYSAYFLRTPIFNRLGV